MSAVAIKVAIQVLIKMIEDEEARKRVYYIVAIPIVFLILLVTITHYIFTMPFEALSQAFGSDAVYAESVVADYGDNADFMVNIPTDFTDFDYSNYDPLDKEAFVKLMEEAKKYIGFPYVFGGSSPTTSFDCSGFICWVYTKSGVYNLPRTTAQGIYNQSVPIPKEEARAGDLIFFHSTYNSVGKVSHIGIYMGDGTMLHCGSPIGFAKIDTTYWTKHFYGYGRLILSKTEVEIEKNKV